MSANAEEYNGTPLPKVAANYAALTPNQFLERAATVFPDRLAVIHGARRLTWSQLYARSRRLASALRREGIGHGDVVTAILSNTPEHLECLHGVPMSGAVLNPLNYRLDARNIAFILRHSGAKLLITDTEFAGAVSEALGQLSPEERPVVVDVDDDLCEARGPRLGQRSYEELIAAGDPDAAWEFPPDEWDAIALCYTSGTTADPKGVVLHHRGMYLGAMNGAITWSMPQHPVYLWTLPMFHCCGWCFPWTVAALAGTHVCLRKVDAAKIFQLIPEHHVTHLCGAPIVMTALLAHNGPRTWNQSVKMMTAASAPPAAVIAGMAKLDIEVTHVYGLTEVYGPASVCQWKAEWNDLPQEEQAIIKARQGVRYLAQEGLMVADAETLVPVPQDGETLGEVFFRGNLTMKGYLKNPSATEKAFGGGWFHTGDLAVWDPDGYIKLKDRSKDIIISGGENISSLEVESILYKHPKIAEVAVVARDDATWGETPCAFLEVKPGESVTDEEMYKWCRENMVNYMVPRTFVMEPLPRTSTGKVQKHVLRSRTKELTKAPISVSSKLENIGNTPSSKL
jgi:fatty-acyl-CoA synthase